MKSVKLLFGDNPPVQNKVQLVTGNIFEENRVKQRKSSCFTEFKVAMKSIRLIYEVNPPVQNRVKLVNGRKSDWTEREKREKILMLNKVKSGHEKRQTRIWGYCSCTELG